MQKTNLAILLLLCVSMLSSYGPRRYGCGPRRCEIKTQEQTTVPQTLEKSTSRVV